LFTRRTRGVARGPTRELQAALELAAGERNLRLVEVATRIVEQQSLLTPSTRR